MKNVTIQAVRLLLVAVAIGLSGLVNAQHDHTRCATSHYLKNQEQIQPDLLQKRQAVDRLIQRRITEKREGRSSDVVVEIPVVVHVLYRTNEENISLSKIQSQLDVLNDDYRMLNSNRFETINAFSHLAADTRIQFKLAEVDPEGNPTSGIIRKQTNKTGFDYTSNEAKKTALGGSDPWDVNRYLNLWIVNTITYQGIGGTLGYAQFPGLDPATDGVVIVYNAFGTVGPLIPPYDGGRTATHEIGHWLGLYHLWGLDANDGCNASDDDQIDDTPLQSTSSSNCELNKTTCGNLNMVQNFMDYSNDDCMTFFTVGQVARMREVLTTIRPGFLQTEADFNLAVTGLEGAEGLQCGSGIQPTVTITNYGDQTITTLDLTLQLNEEEVYTGTFFVDIEKNASTTIELQAIAVPTVGAQTLEVMVSKPNGQLDEVPDNDIMASVFEIHPGELMAFEIMKASLNNQMSWVISNNNGSILLSSEVAQEDKNDLMEQYFCLADGDCYEFEIEAPFIANLCGEYPQWNESAQYTAGDQFVYQGRIYEATTTIWGVDPITFAHFFKDLGDCPDVNEDDDFALSIVRSGEVVVTAKAGSFSEPFSSDFCLEEIVTGSKNDVSYDLFFYPNPTHDYIYFSERIDALRIYDRTGRLILEKESVTSIALPEDMLNGVFLLELVNGEQVIHDHFLKE